MPGPSVPKTTRIARPSRRDVQKPGHAVGVTARSVNSVNALGMHIV
ncbi:hypothetical protein C7S13_8389 [Burkholderia cepacia]|nr:hypothetical protein [Burkholderia cepacia]